MTLTRHHQNLTPHHQNPLYPTCPCAACGSFARPASLACTPYPTDNRGDMRTTLEQATVRSQHAAVNGIDIHYIEAGPPDGRAVILLHGFPEL